MVIHKSAKSAKVFTLKIIRLYGIRIVLVKMVFEYQKMFRYKTKDYIFYSNFKHILLLILVIS